MKTKSLITLVGILLVAIVCSVLTQLNIKKNNVPLFLESENIALAQGYCVSKPKSICCNEGSCMYNMELDISTEPGGTQ